MTSTFELLCSFYEVWQELRDTIMYISGAKFEEHCSNILEIFLIQYFTVLVNNL